MNWNSYSRKIKLHRFHIDNNEGELVIGYDMIIGRDLMVQIGLLDHFKCQVFQWDGSAVPMKDPISFLDQTDSTSHNMCEVVIQTT